MLTVVKRPCRCPISIHALVVSIYLGPRISVVWMKLVVRVEEHFEVTVANQFPVV
jgi:hypothetical protein